MVQASENGRWPKRFACAVAAVVGMTCVWGFASADAYAAGQGSAKAGSRSAVSAAAISKRRAGRPCRHGHRTASASRRRPCRSSVRSRVGTVLPGAPQIAAAPQAPEPTSRSPEPDSPNPSPDQAPPGSPLPVEPPGEDPPPSVTPRCELVPGDCSIYSDRFWILLAKYERFEIDTGVYPMPPECMEAGEKNPSVVCTLAIVFLYPDGTMGSSSWVVDPCAPNGWRFWEPDPPTC